MTTPATTHNRKVVILGAAGRFGLAATRAFARAGWQVFAQVRPARSVDAMPEITGVTWIAQGLDETERLASEAEGAEFVVHAVNPGYCNIAWCKESPVLLTQAIDLARRLKARVMLPGNIYNYGADMPELLDEHTPQRATDAKGMVRIAMEQQLAAAAREGVPSVVIRAGDYFGAGTGSWFDLALGKDLWQGRMVYPGRPDIDHAWAYLPDFAQTFVRVAETNVALADFEVLHFSGHTVMGNHWRDALSAIARRLQWLPQGGSLSMKGIPWWLMKAGSVFHPSWRAVVDMRHLWDRAHRIDNRRLLAVIGSEPHTPFPQAVQAAVAEMYPHVLPVTHGVDSGIAGALS